MLDAQVAEPGAAAAPAAAARPGSMELATQARAPEGLASPGSAPRLDPQQLSMEGLLPRAPGAAVPSPPGQQAAPNLGSGSGSVHAAGSPGRPRFWWLRASYAYPPGARINDT